VVHYNTQTMGRVLRKERVSSHSERSITLVTADQFSS